MFFCCLLQSLCSTVNIYRWLVNSVLLGLIEAATPLSPASTQIRLVYLVLCSKGPLADWIECHKLPWLRSQSAFGWEISSASTARTAALVLQIRVCLSDSGPTQDWLRHIDHVFGARSTIGQQDSRQGFWESNPEVKERLLFQRVGFSPAAQNG